MVKRLPEDAQKALAQEVAQAQALFQGSVDGVNRILNDLYTGRDPASGGVPEGGVPWNQPITDTTSVGQNWMYPQVGANLMQARVQQLVTELVPAIPSFQVEALTAEATHLAEDQADFMPWLCRAGNLRAAMRRSAMHGLMGPHFGVKVCVDKDAPVEERIRFEAVPASHCGYEPKHRRFMWHQYTIQWGKLPKEYRPKGLQTEPQAWEPVQVTEVYHKNFGDYRGKKCPTSYFVTVGDKKADAHFVASEPDRQPLGDYVCTVELPCCPIYIDHFLDPAPGEDVSAPECASWVPILRSIHADIRQIEQEVGSINNIVLVEEESVDDDQIADMRNNPMGETVYIKVKAHNDAGEYTGVSHKVRPVERNSALNEIVGALQTHLQLLDEVIGVSSLDRGVAANPRKSATEASAIVQANNRRTRSRLTVLSDAFGALGGILYNFLPMAFGKSVKMPLANGLNKTIEILNPATARMAFRVEPVELGNLSKQGQVETHAASLTLLTNLRQQAPDLIPPTLVVEEARKYLKTLGNHAAAAALQSPVMAGGPLERIRDFVYGRTIEIPVNPTDDHETFIAAYQAEIQAAALQPGTNIPVAEIQRALAAHQQFANTRPQPAAPQSPVPGFSATGGVDNNTAAALEAGGVPIDAISELSLNNLRP